MRKKQYLLRITVSLLMLTLTPSIFGQGLPELNDTNLENLPADLRPRVRQAYEELYNGKEDSEQAGEMGQIFHAHRELDFAIPLYRMAHRLDPEKFDWIYLLSIAQARNNQIEESIPTLRQALEINPDYSPGHFRMGELLQQTGSVEESLPHFLKVAEAEPDSAAAQFEAGKAYLELKDYEKAILYLERACRLFEGFGPAHYSLVQAYRFQGNMAKAKEQLELYQANRLKKPFIEDPVLEMVHRLRTGAIRAKDHIRKGIELGRMNRISEAIIEFNRALEIEPENASIYIDLMILYGRSKQVDEARRLYESAPESVADGTAELHYNYGVIQVEAENYTEAANAFRQVIRINPIDARAYNNLGQMMEKSADFENALKQYQSALKIDPQFRAARFNQGRILIGFKRYEEAISELLKILKPEDESTALYTFILSVAYVRSGNLEKGIEYSEQALELAKKYGQTDLIQSIESNLAKLRQATGSNPWN